MAARTAACWWARWTNQRPDLFAAAMPQVGVMDMLRFTNFTAGRYWVGDYGDPAKEADFTYNLTYSPYHNIRGGSGLSGDPRHHRRYRRSRRAGPQLQICRRAPGGGYRPQAASDPDRDARRPWIGQADLEGDRGICRYVGVRGLLDGDGAACEMTGVVDLRAPKPAGAENRHFWMHSAADMVY
jgi:hypothetical protein